MVILICTAGLGIISLFYRSSAGFDIYHYMKNPLVWIFGIVLIVKIMFSFNGEEQK